MTTSTPPAWAWLDLPIAYPANALSIHSRKVPDSATLREQNDSPDPTYQGCLPSERHPSDGPERAVSTTASGTCCADQCDISGSPVVSCDRKDDATGCDEAAKVTNAQSYAAETHTAEPIETVWACPACAGLQGRHDCGQNEEPAAETHEDLQGKDADSFVVTSCPECDSATDIDYGTVKDKPPDCQGCEPEPARSAIGAGPLFGDGVDIIEEPAVETHEDLQGKDADKMADTFDVPFRVQQFMFEELAEVQAEYLHDILKDHTPLIVEMARDRFRDGYKLYGSKMFAYTPEERLRETLCELADAVCYLTSGPIE